MTKNQLAHIIGKNLLKYRTENNLTQEELAEKVGISTSFYANIERGNRSYESTRPAEPCRCPPS